MRQLERGLGNQGDHLLHLGPAGALAHCRQERAQRLLAPRRGDLDVAARKVAHPPRQLQRPRPVLDKPAKADPLDPACNLDVYDGHERARTLSAGGKE